MNYIDWSARTAFYNDDYVTKQGRNDDFEQWMAVCNELVSIFSPALVLDCGCGIGRLPYAFYKAGVECYGFDVNECAINIGKERYPEIADKLFVHDLGTQVLPFPDKHFDLVVARELVEHFDDDHIFFAVGEIVRVASLNLRVTSPVVYSKEVRVHKTKTLSEWFQWLRELNKNDFSDNLKLVDRDPNLMSTFPASNNSMEHPNEHGRGFWIGLFELLGFRYVQNEKKAFRFDGHPGFGICDFKRIEHTTISEECDGV